jgi:steroid delta-isomerase-like uncharacterized protein
MSTETNKQLVQRYFDEVHTARRYELVDELVAPDYKEHNPLPGQRDGRDGMRDRDRTLHESLDVRFEVEDLIAEGDKVVARWRNRGTHVGEFLGMPATGKSFSIEGINIYRVRDGRLVEGWDVVDVFGQLLQLGLIPSPAVA